MDTAGHRNIAHPAPAAWTLPQELQVIAWLTKHPIPHASTATTGATTPSGSRAAGSGPAVPTIAPSHTASPASGYHTRAFALAGRIAGCRPQRLTPAAAGQRLQLAGTPPAASAAVCALRGHSVIILAFPGPASQATVDAQVRTHVAFYATGPGWIAVPVNTGVPVAQQSAVQDAAIALHGTIASGTR